MRLLIYLVGLYFLGGTLHELVHYLDCGGFFMVGFHFPPEFGSALPFVGVTDCARALKWGEVPAYMVEILVWLIGIIVWRH